MIERPVTEALKAIREEASVGVREMARRVGIAPNTYTHYENPDRFKSQYLPMEWAMRFADALAENGVDRNRILALAGTIDSVAQEGIDARAARLSSRRYDLLLALLEDLEAAEEVDRAKPKRVIGDEG